MTDAGFIVIIIIAILFIFVARAFGSWMFRINDVIKEQERTNELLQKLLEK